MKRKLITILSLVVVIALSLGIFASCNKGLKTDQLDKLFQEFTKQHKNDVKESPSSYWVDGSVFYYDDDGKEVSVNVKWTIEGTSLVTVGTEANVRGQYQVVVPDEEQQTAVDYKLVGTLVDADGKAYTDKDGKEYKLEISKTLPAGKTYKLAIKQLANGTVIYAKAAVVSNYYIDSAETAVAGADFQIERVDGGVKIYTMIGATKAYLGAKVNGNYNNICLGGVVGEMDATTYQGSVWTISDDLTEIKTVVGDKTLYLGTYDTHTTFSVSTTKTYPAMLVEVGTTVKAQAEVKGSKDNANCTIAFTSHTADSNNVVVVDTGSTVKFTVTPAEGYEILSVNNGSTPLTADNGVYSVTANTGVTIAVESRKIGSTGAESPVTGNISNAIPAGWTYIPNNPEYPKPGWYGNGSLKMNYTDMGISSPDLDKATGYIAVDVKIASLNPKSTSKESNVHVFEITALDANGEVVVKGYIDTVAAGQTSTVVLDAGDKIVKTVSVVMVEFPAVDGKEQNVGLGSVTIAWGDDVEPPVVDNSVAKIGETGYETLDAAIEAAQANDTIVLQKDVVVTTNIVVGKKVTLNLNGKTISNTVDIWDDTKGVDIWSLISVRENGELTITGNGKLDAKENDVFAVDVRGGGKVIIENGEFIGNKDAVYVSEGSAEIKGGKFNIKQLSTINNDRVVNGHEFTLNLYDANGKNGTATITVTGGQFVNYNPAASASEDPVANFVATGYKSTSKTEGEVTVWTVEIATEGAGTEADPYTVADAMLIAPDSGYSKEVWIKGIVVVGAQTQNGPVLSRGQWQFYIADTATGEGVQIRFANTVEGTEIIGLGDTVLVKGLLTKYQGNAQMAKNDNGTEPVIAKIESRANGTVKEAESNEHVTITFTNPAPVEGVVTAQNGTKVTFTVVADDGYEVASIKSINGLAVTETETKGTYEILLSGNMEIEVVAELASGPKTLTIVSPNKGAAVDATSTDLSETLGIKAGYVKITSAKNNASGPLYLAAELRFYGKADGNGTSLTITAEEGYKITSIKITYAAPNGDKPGTLQVKVDGTEKLNEAQQANGTERTIDNISANEIVLQDIVTGSTNQVRIASIEIVVTPVVAD